MKKSLAITLTALVLSFFFLPACRTQKEEGEVALSIPSYEIATTLSTEEKTLDVETHIRYSIPQDELAAVKLRLYAGAYTKEVVSPSKVKSAYPSEKKYGDVTVIEVTSNEEIKGYSVSVEDKTLLTVRLAEKKKKGDEVLLTIHTAVALANVKHRLGYADDYYMLSGFYPVVCFPDF